MASDVLAYCMRCRTVTDEARATCIRCPDDEPLINVADPDALQMVSDMESSAALRHLVTWQSGMAVIVGLLGGGLLLALIFEFGDLSSGSGWDPDASRGQGSGWSLFFPFIACGAAGAGLGTMISRRLRRVRGRAEDVQEAIANFEATRRSRDEP